MKHIFLIKRDRDELKVTFTKLGVMPGDLKVYNDLTDTQMREKIEGVARMANERPDCAWVGVIILSHGRQVLGEDEVLGMNGIFNDFAAKKNNQYGTPKLTISPLFFNDSAAKAIKFAAICLQNRR